MLTQSQSDTLLRATRREPRPVAGEQTVHAPRVRGELPAGLDGLLLAAGAGPGAGPDAGHHLHGGDPLVHGLRLRDGEAQWYRSRWLRTDRACRRLGELTVPGPRRALADDAGAALVGHGGRILALGDDGALPVELGPELNTVARGDFDGTLPNGFASHPVLDPVTGELHAVAFDHRRPYVEHVAVDRTGRVRRARRITVKQSPMMHAFSLTERYAVLYDLPVVADGPGPGPRYQWDDRHGARLGLLPRDGGDDDILWIEIEPCYVFHPVNAYETGRHLVIDAIRHPAPRPGAHPLDPGQAAPGLWRWTVDRLSGTVLEEQLDDFVEELPGIDPRRSGLPHRYAFTTAVRPDGRGAATGTALLRHDLLTGRTAVHRVGAGRTVGEGVFVPRGPGAPEGDGWVLGLVHDRERDSGSLVVVDTADFTGAPVAEVLLPDGLPAAGHTAWVPGG
ncbi:carotenoid oxygenase family protein [Kitasatospora sp. NPDC087315]|uniref:carotenoid oxygenase family protein n=1 Tax=Kitasatospora sp. NPDC087315 TaxID=3364069 RepID=UPI003815E176